jgi:hypothetical protein
MGHNGIALKKYKPSRLLLVMDQVFSNYGCRVWFMVFNATLGKLSGILPVMVFFEAVVAVIVW